MVAPALMTLRLPAWLRARKVRVPALLAARGLSRRADVLELSPLFELHAHEARFARNALARHPRFWLYRCNQKGACGDFVLVDMSSPEPARRNVIFLELKLGEAIRFGRGWGSPQLKNHLAALVELERAGVVTADAPRDVLVGNPAAVLGWMGGQALVG